MKFKKSLNSYKLSIKGVEGLFKFRKYVRGEISCKEYNPSWFYSITDLVPSLYSLAMGSLAIELMTKSLKDSKII